MGDNGNISVNVTDGTDAVSGATVSLTDSESQTTSETTDSDGAVIFEDVANGEYTLSITKQGYQTETDTVTVAGTDVTVNAVLTAIDTLTIKVDDGTDAIEGASVVLITDRSSFMGFKILIAFLSSASSERFKRLKSEGEMNE